jgi:hypothetical protein
MRFYSLVKGRARPRRRVNNMLRGRGTKPASDAGLNVDYRECLRHARDASVRWFAFVLTHAPRRLDWEVVSWTSYRPCR